MLIRERRTVTASETMTALSGIFHPCVTCKVMINQSGVFLPRIRQDTYIAEEIRERYSLITRKGPQLSRCGSYFGDRAGSQGEDKNGCQGIGGGKAAGGVVENLDKGISSRAVENVVDVAEGEAKGDKHDKAQDGIDGNRSHDSFWQGL